MDLENAKRSKEWDIIAALSRGECLCIPDLTYLGKICPEISSDVVFDKEEWKILYCCARKTKEVPETYTLKEAIYDLGILGGMKGAPSDGMPRARSIWQGLEVLCLLLAYRNYIL